MTAVGTLAPKTEWPAGAPSKTEVLERLEHWRRVLLEFDVGSNMVMPRAEILRTLDRWLDELSDLRGR